MALLNCAAKRTTLTVIRDHKIIVLLSICALYGFPIGHFYLDQAGSMTITFARASISIPRNAPNPASGSSHLLLESSQLPTILEIQIRLRLYVVITVEGVGCL